MPIAPNTRRRLEIAANIAIVVVAIIIVANFIRTRSQPVLQPDGPTIGTEVSMPALKSPAGNTLVLALQAGCRYCDESVGFYRRLHDQRTGTQSRMLAVIPGDKLETTRYLSEKGVLVDEVINAPLSKINVSATPTLFLVDSAGKVRDVWIGKLNEREEAEVARRIHETN